MRWWRHGGTRPRGRGSPRLAGHSCPAGRWASSRSATASPMRIVQPMGVSAQLADARAKLKDAAPPDRWDAVMDEVSRVQIDQSASLLQAMHIVLRKLADGWIPFCRN